MSQIDRGTYVRDDAKGGLKGGCVGKLLKVFAAVVVLLLVAMVSVPSDDRMKSEVENAVTLSIIANVMGPQDQSDDVVRNLTSIINAVDTAAIKMDQFHVFQKMNKIEVYRHALFSTARIHHLGNPGGTRVAIGFLGLVIPTVTSNDYLLRTEPLRKDYGNRPLGGSEMNGILDEYDEDYNPYIIGVERDM